MISRHHFVLAAATAALPVSFSALGAKWEPLTGEELRALYTDTTLTIKTKKGNYTGYYCADGRGVLVVNKGDERPRTWSMKGNDQVCSTTEEGQTSCFTYVREREKPHVVKAKDVGRKTEYRLTLEEGKPDFCN